MCELIKQLPFLLTPTPPPFFIKTMGKKSKIISESKRIIFKGHFYHVPWFSSSHMLLKEQWEGMWGITHTADQERLCNGTSKAQMTKGQMLYILKYAILYNLLLLVRIYILSGPISSSFETVTQFRACGWNEQGRLSPTLLPFISWRGGLWKASPVLVSPYSLHSWLYPLRLKESK